MTTEVKVEPFTSQEIDNLKIRPIGSFYSARTGEARWPAMIARAEACRKLGGPGASIASRNGENAIRIIAGRFCEALCEPMVYTCVNHELEVAMYCENCDKYVAALLEIYKKFNSEQFFMIAAGEICEAMEKFGRPMP